MHFTVWLLTLLVFNYLKSYIRMHSNPRDINKIVRFSAGKWGKIGHFPGLNLAELLVPELKNY